MKECLRFGNFFIDKLPIWLYNSITEPEIGGERLELKEARIKAGMSINALAKAVGVSPAAICRYEKGKRSPKLPIAKKIAAELNVPWYVLVDNIGEEIKTA